MSSTELARVATEANARIGGSNPEFNKLIQEALRKGIKIKSEKVMMIWKIANVGNFPGLTSNILWVQDNTATIGYQHMLKHEKSFEELGVPKEKLAECAQAVTSVGRPGGFQGDGPGRPIFGLFFHGKPLAVAITVGWEGFIVGMNKSNYGNFLREAKITEEELKVMNSWPAEP